MISLIPCYTYISQSQVDEIYCKLPFHRRWPVSFSAGLKTQLIELLLKSKEDSISKHAKIKAIKKFLHEKKIVGDIDASKEFITGIGNFYWGDYRSESQSGQLVCFDAVIKGSRLKLVGSKASAIGTPPQGRTMSYFDPQLMESLVEAMSVNPDLAKCNTEAEATGLFDRKYDKTRRFHQTMEFIARPVYREKGIMIAAPVFIVIASYSYKEYRLTDSSFAV